MILMLCHAKLHSNINPPITPINLMPQESNLTMPTVHMNGSGFDTLFNGYDEAADELRKFTDKFGRIEFNARDYYVQGPDAYTKAREQRDEINAKIRDIKKYLDDHLMRLDDQRRPTRS